MDLVARHFETGQRVRLRISGAAITECSPNGDQGAVSDADEWIAPAFWDLQMNGRWGISFADPALTPEQVVEIIRAQARFGTSRVGPTLITSPRTDLVRALQTIDDACRTDPDLETRVAGIHLEGPYISECDGYRGAHRRDAVRDPDWGEFELFQGAAGGRIKLLTLAPERPGAIDFIRKATSSGIVIALGHTAADVPTIRAAVAAGARLSTHLGNGIASPLPRHPNPIWEQAACDELSASFIADGHHIDTSTLRVLVRAKGLERTVLVSDASPLAGLPAGRYGEWEVDPSGKIVVAGTPYLAGSNRGLDACLDVLFESTRSSPVEALRTVTRNPARLLGCDEPTLAAGQPANMVLFRLARRGNSLRFVLTRTCVNGTWVDAGEPERPPWAASVTG